MILAEIPLHLRDLNDAQRAAVQALDGPVLVLAGAGTGKTRVLTARLAHLLATGRAHPSEIMAVTFTNKAAQEIRNRVAALLGQPVEGWFLGTFHSLAARLLRPYAERLGLQTNFNIIDTDDQLRLIKQILEAENIDSKKTPPRLAASIIQRWKDRALRPQEAPDASRDIAANGRMNIVYRLYQERLKTLNACDFGDLILHQITLLRDNPDVLSVYHDKFRWLLVDEYQDTNVAQYLWLRLLAQKNQNICCVGDEDQSIYGWRGAEITNILRFEEDFPGAQVIRLEENYRSTGNILAAAGKLIGRNNRRLGKNLWTSAEQGAPVDIHLLSDGIEEARWASDAIENLRRQGVMAGQIAIMVRAGFQTRLFEERFINIGLPYRVLVGARFYERQEVRDAIAYLRLLMSPQDDLAFERIINVPKRGIGTAAMLAMRTHAAARGIPIELACRELCDDDNAFKPRLRMVVRMFLDSLVRWRALVGKETPDKIAATVLEESGYCAFWQNDTSPDAPSRLENLRELVNAIQSFDTVSAFLEHVSLVLDATNESNAHDQVSLMTLHGAKGLEFDHVFLPGWEEEIFPSRLSLTENGAAGLEEERRLAYVGLTRARQCATITYAGRRMRNGIWLSSPPSRFVSELPEANVRRFSHLRPSGDGYSINPIRRSGIGDRRF